MTRPEAEEVESIWETWVFQETEVMDPEGVWEGEGG